MIPKLLVNNNQQIIQEYIDSQISKFAISPFSILEIGKDNSAIKIEQIRQLKQKLSLKSFSGTKKATIIWNAENLTVEAQNTCLKILEEPPLDTVILLTTTNENLLLPTIISRCEVIRIKNYSPRGEAGELGIRSKDKSTTSVENIQRMDTGERFALAEQLCKKLDKDEKLEDVRRRVEKWLDDLIEEIHSEIIGASAVEPLPKQIKSTLLAKRQIKQNLNMRLVLENLLIGL